MNPIMPNIGPKPSTQPRKAVTGGSLNRKILLGVRLALSIIIVASFGFEGNAEENSSKFIFITGDLNKPYEIIDMMYHIETIEGTLLKDPFDVAMAKGLQAIKNAATKNKWDAVINLRMEVVLFPVATSSGKAGKIIYYGTVVRLK